MLNDMFPSDNKDKLVGVESRIKEIESLLCSGSKDFCSVGIWGIGGIGKTTIAGAIFKKISNQFEGSCFLANVREEEEKNGGLNHLREEFLFKLLGNRNVKIDLFNIGLNFESKRLRRKKVLIVLDDVTRFEQIELLIGGFDWFATRSRVIITTRDKHVLNICRVDEIYEMKKLVHIDALTLFCRHAFRRNNPDVGFEELSEMVISYAQGIPLALKVLGRFLVERSKEEWESAIYKLERIPNMDIQKVLRISYDGLDREEQNIFLDIACFLKGEERELVIKFLDVCDFSAEIGIRALVDKSLIIILYNKITMHDLLQEMGKEIVRQESIKDPEKRSRLWHHEDIYKVLTYNTGTEAIEGISLDMSKVNEFHLNPNILANMPNLRFLKFYGRKNKCKVDHFQESGFGGSSYFHWDGYPLKSLPSNIHPENLVSLNLRDSTIKQLWNGIQNLVNLKQIDLSGSTQLTKFPELSLAPILESLNLKGCTSMVETHSSIKYLNNLIKLDLTDCKSLKSLPSIMQLESLKKLFLSGCSNLKGFPEISSCNLEWLRLDGTAIEELPSSIECLSKLHTLDLEDCKKLESLPSSLCKLKSLQYLYLDGCSTLQSLPDEFGNLKSLKRLYAARIGIRELRSSILCFENLSRSYLDGLESLTYLWLIDCGITELPESLGQLSSLIYLYLDINSFEKIPESIIKLSKLQWLSLSYCERLQYLPELPCNINYMDAHCCTSLVTLSGLSILFIPDSFHVLQFFDLSNCLKLDRDELNEIVRDALPKIQFIATACWKERDQAYYQNVGCDICYPGSEIPLWFSFQNIGSSINLVLPPSCFDDKFVGIAFCAIVQFQHYHDNDENLEVFCECKLKTGDGEWHVVDVASLSVGRIDRVGLDHVVLGYNFSKCPNSFDEIYYNVEVLFQFYLQGLDEKPISCCKVKKCGIRLFYAHDFGKSRNSYGGTSFSSDEEVEEEEERHPKGDAQHLYVRHENFCPFFS